MLEGCRANKFSFIAKRYFANASFHAFDDCIRCGSAGGDANGVVEFKPVIAQISGVLNVMHARAKFAASSDKLAGVVAVAATDNDDDAGILREFDRRALPLFGGLAHSVDETHF